MVTRICPLLVVLALFAASAGWAARVERIAPPVWPQTFSLSPGEKAEFGFYVTQAGPITVSVTWRSGQVAVALKNPASRSVASTPLGNGPVELNYSSVETDMGSGAVRWFVSVSRPGSGRGDTVDGTISVRCPPVDMAKVQTAPPPQLTADTSTGLAMQQFQLGVANKLQSYNKARLDQIASLTAQLRTRMAAASQISTRSNKQSRSMSTTIKQNVISAASLIKSPLAGKAPMNMLEPYVPPQIQAVNPPSGYQGQETVLQTKNIKPDKTKYEAWFTIAQGVTVQATIVSATAASYGADLKVQVPGASGMNQNYPSGQVFVRDIVADATSDSGASDIDIRSCRE